MTKYISPINDSTEFVELSLKSSTRSSTLSGQEIHTISKIDISVPMEKRTFEKNQLSMSSVPADIAIEIVKCFLKEGG